MYTNPRQAPPPAYDPHPQPQWQWRTTSAHPRNSADAPVEQTPLLPQQQNVARKRPTIGTALIRMSLMLFVYMMVSRLCDAYNPGAALDRMRREWDSEMRAHEKRIRLGWERERTEIIAMREQVLRDQEQWMKERDEERHEEERKRQAEEERIRAGFAWDDLKGDQRCLQHGMRRYTARIANVPREYDPVTACTETAVEIHGMRIPNPNQCEDRGCGGVIGHWLISHSEPTCATHFDNFKDKEKYVPCEFLLPSPLNMRTVQRIESHLENLQPGDDWRNMCSTTPAHFWGLHFDSPGVCEDWGKYGIWGIWEIEDSQC
ncbi:hypothetical protein C8F04DRAFT_1034096 [Mycena alexandri]|uniref:Uncharacterized protein n=1 Tax=Mycena alexandri TaxID=1745969 RepID=A0AAD6T466_9AGAR|nr:hypothetical protein C8F04DRAFT_1034096 [Mycena alexandri]